jgi:hypothetical protein
MVGRILVAIAVAIALLGSAPLVQAQGAPAAGKLYKWVDKDGNVHFSDQVPPESAEYKREQLNDQGVSVQTTDRARTPEEQAKVDAEEKAAADLAKKLAEERKADDALLNSYASEADLTRAYNQRMDLLGQTIDARRIEINAREQSLSSLVAQAANLERGGKPVSDTLKQMITAERGEIDKQKAYLQQKDGEKGKALTDYQRDMARYKAALARNAERDKQS